MNQLSQHTQSLDPPSRLDGDLAVRQAQRLYGRMLACWASEALALRRAGLNRAIWRAEHRDGDSWSLAA